MDVIWLLRARRNLQDIFDYLNAHDPAAAQRTAAHLYASSLRLGDLTRLGRKGYLTGTRELVVAYTPYFLRYRIKASRVEVLRVIDGRTNWLRRP